MESSETSDESTSSTEDIIDHDDSSLCSLASLDAGRVYVNGDSSLHQAARSGDLESVRKLLKQQRVRKNIDELDSSGMSALHFAARFNHAAVVNLLLHDGKANAGVRDKEGATPLHFACRRRRKNKDESECDTGVNFNDSENQAIVKSLGLRSDINMKDSYGITPLHVAAMRGNLVAMTTLLKMKDIIINAREEMGCTPLHEAATFNQVEAARQLIEHGASMHIVDSDLCTPLHLAALEGFAEIGSLLVESCKESRRDLLIQAKDCEKCTALHYSVEAKSLPLVKLLVEHGADVNGRCRTNTLNSSPLHLAASSADAIIAEFLIQCKADMNARDGQGSTPLHKAAGAKNRGVARLLLANISTTVDPLDLENYTPLLVAVCYDDVELVKLLLDEGANIQATEHCEKTLLNLAVANEQEKVLEHLLERADAANILKNIINADDRSGNTPLHTAAEAGNLNITKILLKNGAAISTKNEEEETAFLIASKLGHLQVVKHYIEHCMTVLNDQDEYSNTALHLAAKAGHLPVVEVLCENSADKIAKNTRSRTPLDLAAEGGHENVVRYLLDEDVPVNPTDTDVKRLTALHLACKYGHGTVVTLLIERGADVTVTDEEGNTPLVTAIESGNRNAVEAILSSQAWHKALCFERYYPDGRSRDTPLRRLILHMPGMAQLALNRCVKTGPVGVSLRDEEKYIEFNYEFLDDTYTPYVHEDRAKIKVNVGPNDDITPPDHLSCYTSDYEWAKQNHPLTILAEEKWDTLICHPLVLALTRHKWDACKSFYYTFLLFYALFVSMFTAYMVIAEPPYQVNSTLYEYCYKDDAEWEAEKFQDVAKYILIILAVVGMIIEVLQLIGTGRQYFDYIMYLNAVDWFTYVSAILVVLDLTNCGYRKAWQWQVGAVGMLFAWLDLLMYCRRLPGLGIYVVMMTQIFFTFSTFFIIFFLFIVAFGFTFHVLLQNQDPYESRVESIVKTWVMMMGDFDFNGIFHPDEFSQDEDAEYRTTTFVVFLMFLVVMGIIVVNLLIGLAVDDVGALRHRSKVVKLAMQIDLALIIEFALPKSWRRFLNYNKWKQRYWPNATLSRMEILRRTFTDITNGRTLQEEAICTAVMTKDAADMEQDIEMINFEDRFNQKIEQAAHRIRHMNAKMEETEGLIMKVLRKIEERRYSRSRRPRRETVPEMTSVSAMPSLGTYFEDGGL